MANPEPNKPDNSANNYTVFNWICKSKRKRFILIQKIYIITLVIYNVD